MNLSLIDIMNAMFEIFIFMFPFAIDEDNNETFFIIFFFLIFISGENESQSLLKLRETTTKYVPSPSFRWDTFVNYGEVSFLLNKIRCILYRSSVSKEKTPDTLFCFLFTKF